MPNNMELIQALLNSAQSNSGGANQTGQEKMPTMMERFEQKLDPLQMTEWESVKKGINKQTQQGFEQGIKPEQMLDKIIKQKATSPFAFGGVEMQGENVIQKQPGFAAGLLMTLLSGSPYTPQRMDIQRQAGLQELAGQKPLQKGEREKLGIQWQQDLIKEMSKLNKEGNLKPNDIFQAFEQASKAFIVQRDAQARIEAMQEGTGYDDLGLIFSYMKVLDPNSVVRESEFANAASAASFLNRTYGQVVKFTKGGRLAPESRKQLIDSARRIFKSSETQQTKTTNQFKILAEKNGINFENVVRDVGLSLSQQVETNRQQSGKTSSGTMWRRIQ